ncbi:MAG: hypothetical protein P4L40_19100 [Terracidiphilus sp.]|nr:hypothetical protein [Terracidiphilus sp.]
MPFSEADGLADQAIRIAKGDFDKAEPAWTSLPAAARGLLQSLLTVDMTQVRCLPNFVVLRGSVWCPSCSA